MSSLLRYFRNSGDASLSQQLPPLRAANGHVSWSSAYRPSVIENTVLILDIVLIAAASWASGLFYGWFTLDPTTNSLGFFSIGVLAAVNFVAFNCARRNYKFKKLAVLTLQLRETAAVWSIICGFLAVIGFAMKISSDYSRGATLIFFSGSLLALISTRTFVSFFIERALATGSFSKKKIILVAERNRALSSQALLELQRHGYVPVSTYYLSEAEIASSGACASLRGKLSDLIDLARSEKVEGVYLLVGWHHHRSIDTILDALNVLPLPVHLIPDEYAARFSKYPLLEIGNTWTLEVRRPPLTLSELAAKRSMDILGAGVGLFILLPLLVFTAILIKADSRGPVFFLQKRNGFNGRAFNILKFRTMHVMENDAVVNQTTRNDPRVTRVGRWLRRSSVDELPQLINVLRGEMSLVGPRPHASAHNSEYEKLIANYAFRHHVKPGLTGWAQVNGLRGETRRIELMERRVDHDIWYINNYSLMLDIKIALKTLVVAVGQNTAY